MHHTHVVGFALFLILAGCDASELVGEQGDPGPSSKADALADGNLPDGGPSIPSEDQAETVDVGSWNVEWFGDETHGPTDELLQQDNVANVLSQLDLDLVGLVEVVSEDAFSELIDGLPGFDGLIVTDPRVAGGRDFYSAREQKVALVFRTRFTVESARVVLPESAWSFGGRPPMEVTLTFTEDGRPRRLVVVVAHFKAMANADGYQRRVEAAAALKLFLDTEYPTRWVLVIGDLNDDIDTSTYVGSPSPFAALVDDPNYRFTTDTLSEAGLSTTVSYTSTIDHHLVTHKLADRFVEDSARVLRVDAAVDAYAATTSDHYPVLTRYDLR